MEREAALKRAMKYCAEAEHCTQDVERKLQDWGVDDGDRTAIMAILHREKFVDDARYAKTYVSEKWKLNRWGRIKLQHQLEAKGMAAAIIEAALETIPRAEYASGVEEILNQKWKELKEKRDLPTLQKVAVFGLSRGIEEEMIEVWVAARADV
jgi:regulatory protein